MTAKSILVAGVVLFGGAVYGLHTEKMRVTETCRDSRLFMDGGIDVRIESGGLNYHHAVSFFRHHYKKDDLLGSIDVDHEDSSPQGPTMYSGPHMKLTIFKDKQPTKYGTPARLESELGKEQISVALLCSKI
jgi:hypothetical protein